MTKQHFSILAHSLKFSVAAAKSQGGSEAEKAARLSGVYLAIEGVADVCASFNPRFDKARFLEACEVNANVR